jgi:hypothetical protein
MSLVRQAEDMSISDQIAWFIDGLSFELIATCAVQPNGQPWQDLSALAQFAVGEEARLKASRGAAQRSSLARIARAQAPGSQARQGGGPSTSSGLTGSRRAPEGPPKSFKGALQTPGSKAPRQQGTQGPSMAKAKKLDPNGLLWGGDPDAPNAKNPQISDREAARHMNAGICIHCGQQGSQPHAQGCIRNRRG